MRDNKVKSIKYKPLIFKEKMIVFGSYMQQCTHSDGSIYRYTLFMPLVQEKLEDTHLCSHLCRLWIYLTI